MGFALETNNGVANARGKLQRKRRPIVLNAPADSIGAETNKVTLVEAASAHRAARREQARGRRGDPRPRYRTARGR